MWTGFLNSFYFDIFVRVNTAQSGPRKNIYILELFRKYWKKKVKTAVIYKHFLDSRNVQKAQTQKKS